MSSFENEKYVISQSSYNHHIMIKDKTTNSLVCHLSHNGEMMSEEELEQYLYDTLKMIEDITSEYERRNLKERLK